MIRVFLDDAAHLPVVGKFAAAVLQVQGNRGTAFFTRFGGNRKLGLAL
jgi:hypothetical protein